MAVRVPLRGTGLAPLATRDLSLDPLPLRDRRRETAARAAPVPLAGKCRGERVCKAAFAAYPHRKGGGSGIPRTA